MRMRSYLTLGAMSFLIFTSSHLVFAEAQDQNTQQGFQIKSDVDMQWRWGEVVSLDPQNKTLAIEYLDFDTDQEKELPLVVDESTAYENIKSLQDIQLKDTLSVDFIVSDSKNIAKNISIEKPEDTAIPSKPEEVKVIPEAVQPSEN